MNNKLTIAFLAFLISQVLVAQHGHLWNNLEIERNKQYEGYVVDLSGDTINGFIQFADRVTMQEEVYFFLEKSNRKTDTTYKPADLLWYHFLDKTYQCINYSGTLSTTLVKGNLILERNCISKYVWFREVDDFADQRREANETMIDYMNRLYPSNEVHYNVKQRKAITLDYFLLSFEKRMSSFIRENPELSKKVLDRERGYGSSDVLEIIQEYNANCK
jgi:hypothetical protein